MRSLLVGSRFTLFAISFFGLLLCISQVLGAGQAETTAGGSSAISAQFDGGAFDQNKPNVRARVVYISSGASALAARMIDSDLRTAFRFSRSDLRPTVILELPPGEQIRSMHVAFKAKGAQLDVYITNEMPQNKGDFSF